MEVLSNELNQLNLQENPTQTGIIWQPKCLLHKDKHSHPEQPERVSSIIQHLQKSINSKNIVFVESSQPIDRKILEAVHTQKHILAIQKLQDQSGDTYANSYTQQAAYLSAGGVIDGIDQIMTGEWKNGFAVVRPPGHHTWKDSEENGFCYFNNVAVGAKYLQQNYGLKRILIVDWDVHHGDGTQKIYESDKSVLFNSFHLFNKGYFYPGESGSMKFIGKGQGEGYNINIPWDTKGQDEKNHGDDEYIYSFENFALGIYREFDPQFVLVSSGFDSCKNDHLGDLELTKVGYNYMTKRLMELAEGRILVVLEGGYNLLEIPHCGEGVTRALLGQDYLLKQGNKKLNIEDLVQLVKPIPDCVQKIQQATKLFSPYWKSLGEPVSQQQSEENKGKKQ